MSFTLVPPNLHSGNSSTAMAVSNEGILLVFEKSSDEHQDILWCTEIPIRHRSHLFLSLAPRLSPCMRFKSLLNRDCPHLNTPYMTCMRDFRGARTTRNFYMLGIKSLWKLYLAHYR